MVGKRASAIKTRLETMTKMHNEARAESRENATLGWDASPISTARPSAEGPITNPKDLGPALKRAVAVVKRGEPALLDVVTQPR